MGIEKTKQLFVASPFVTMTGDLASAARLGKFVKLLVGLNVATSPKALSELASLPNLAIRYFTHRFHAKIYLFDESALVGSSNLTDGGMHSNREATVYIDDPGQMDELRFLCEELWTSAAVLTPETLRTFTQVMAPFSQAFNPDSKIEAAIGRVEPTNIRVGTDKKTSEYLFLEVLRRRVYEHFQPAFNEVSSLLSENGLHRVEWDAEDKGSETNRFLNWVRLTHAPGDEWQNTQPRSEPERRSAVATLGREWAITESPRIAADYFVSLEHLRRVFTSEDTLEKSSREDLSTALMCIHAFSERTRFIKGGKLAIIDFFWRQNNTDVPRVKRTLLHLVFGGGDFVRRLYEVLNFAEWKLAHFGESCSLELSGTIRPEMCPPMNGRSAKALKFLGYSVPTS